MHNGNIGDWPNILTMCAPRANDDNQAQLLLVSEGMVHRVGILVPLPSISMVRSHFENVECTQYKGRRCEQEVE